MIYLEKIEIEVIFKKIHYDIEKKEIKVKIKYECLPCLSRQTASLARQVTGNVELQKKIIMNGLRVLSERAFIDSSPKVTADIYNIAKGLSSCIDPFEEEKKLFNDVAIDLIEKYKFEKMIQEGVNPIETAVRLSIAGNIIDFSVSDNLDESHVIDSIEKSLKVDLFAGNMEKFKSACSNALRIMIIGDNSGEIVFDKLLVNALDKSKVTYVVKGGPIVNDATMEDAKYIGMNDLVRVITTGSAIQGAELQYCSDEFRKEFEAHDLIICKGQANFETLDEITGKEIFFLLMAKCDTVANEIGCNTNDFVLLHHNG